MNFKEALYMRITYFLSILLTFLIFNPLPLTAANKLKGEKIKEYRIERSVSNEAAACIDCHKSETPGIFADWANSRHANSNITCIDCHLADNADKDISISHEEEYNKNKKYYKLKVPVSAVVTPKDCSRCHPDEVKEYEKSKHANTLEIMWKIDPWLKLGMASDNERVSGCYTCHGTVVKFENGKITDDSWPNVGVGRINPDGSKGSCSSCHTRHKFSIVEARKPEACGQCHLGPDHPQMEIYMESKHGDIYKTEGDSYNWSAAGGTWTAGVDYRAPTCASCHMSGSGDVKTTHDVTERLSWELQAPLTVRPSEFEPYPAKTDWKIERDKMKDICKKCHSKIWVDNHYKKLDKAVNDYNELYYKPAKAKFDELYEKGLLDREKYFDEPLEWEFYEMWHHEGRRARMGTAMMGPDYAWWHGFYELKKRFLHFMKDATELLKNNNKSFKTVIPASTGTTTKPSEIKSEQ